MIKYNQIDWEKRANMSEHEFENYDEFIGHEKSEFGDLAKSSINNLMISFSIVESEVSNPRNKKDFIDLYLDFRISFRHCYLLTYGKVKDEDLINNVNKLFKKVIPTDKDERIKLLEEAMILVSDWIDTLTAIGLIDLKGNSFNGSYPFEDIIYENMAQLNLENLSDLDKLVVESLITDKGNKYKELFESIEKVINSEESNDVLIDKIRIIIKNKFIDSEKIIDEKLTEVKIND